MNTATHHLDLSLEPKTLFNVSDAAGVQILCRSGSLWVTLDGDPRDIVLDAGDHFTATEDRRALIYALGPASLSLSMASAARPARRTWRARPAAAPRVSFPLQPA
jgi:hypothetical protein